MGACCSCGATATACAAERGGAVVWRGSTDVACRRDRGCLGLECGGWGGECVQVRGERAALELAGVSPEERK